MELVYLSLAGASTLLWIGFCLLPWRPWLNHPVLEAAREGAQDTDGLVDVTVLIPARNEAQVIERTLESVIEQGTDLKIVLIDDGSEDGTVERARRFEARNLQIIRSAPLPGGWSGKLWALEQGRREVTTPYVLLLDADIELDPRMICALKEKMLREGVSCTSLMAAPSMSGLWERLLMPAFVHFFKILYPFRLVNSEDSRLAAAAGGCILMESRALEEIGGFETVRSAVIDDCALARRIKSHGFKIWLGLSRSVRSIRGYRHLKEIWNMVARTAFTQLGYSAGLLLLCTLATVLAYLVPVILLILSEGAARYLSLGSFSGMVLTYLPTLRFYERSWIWALAMPLIAALFLAMTSTSAIRYWRGERTRWKGRIYERQVVG